MNKTNPSAEEKDLMQIILGIKCDSHRGSCFIMALKSARYHTGRNIKTGQRIDQDGGIPIEYANRDGIIENNLCDAEVCCGLVLYLILLDLIGCLFNKRKDVKCSSKNGIERALKTFSQLDDKEICAIVYLRNTLAHNFGLATEGKAKENFKYTLLFDIKAPAIQLPSISWTGDYSDKNETSSTVVGVYALCDEIEKVVSNIYKIYDEGNLTFLKDTTEVSSRFTVIFDS